MIVLLLIVVVSSLSAALLTAVNSSGHELRSSRENLNALYLCEAGVSAAVMNLTLGGDGNVGSKYTQVSHGSGSYYVTATDIGQGRFQLHSTGGDERSGVRAEVVVQQAVGGFFQWGAFGDESMHMDSNAHVDSYDSGNGDYASQATNGSGKDIYANENGNIGSNSNITMDQNSIVHGNGQPGPSSTLIQYGSSVVTGSTTPATAIVAMPNIVVPSFPSLGPLVVNGNPILAAGDYHYDSFKLQGGSLTVTGPARLVLGTFDLDSNTEFWVDATNGPVEIFVLGDFIMGSNTIVSSLTYTPADVALKLLSNNIINPNVNVNLNVVTFNSNSKLYGTIYAPNALVEIDSNFELFGSLVAKRVELDSNARVHFDESLARSTSGRSTAWDALCWRLLPLE